MKYRGDKPRGFAVLPARPKTGRGAAGECNSPRASSRSPGINTRTPGASVRVGHSTTARQHPSHHVKDVGVERCRIPRNCRQLLRIKVFNPRRNCTRRYGGMGTKPSPSTVKVKKRTAFTPGVKPRGTRPVSPVDTTPRSARTPDSHPSRRYQRTTPPATPAVRDWCVPVSRGGSLVVRDFDVPFDSVLGIVVEVESFVSEPNRVVVVQFVGIVAVATEGTECSAGRIKVNRNTWPISVERCLLGRRQLEGVSGRKKRE